MKSFIAPSYTFTTGVSGVGNVDLFGISSFNIKYLVAIINQTKGKLVYSTASEDYRFTDVTGTVVTLFYDTSAMSSSDTLQIIYEADNVFSISNFPSTQPVSGTVTANIGTRNGISTEAKQDTVIGALSAILADLQSKADLTEDQPVISKALSNAVNPTHVEGSENPLSQTLSGYLRVTAIGATASNTDTHPASASGHVPTMSHLLGFNGTTYDRLRSSIANGLQVDVTRMPAVTGAVTANLGTLGGAATESKQDTAIGALSAILTDLQGKADLTETQPVSIATMPTTPVTGTFFQSVQPVSIVGKSKVGLLFNDYSTTNVTTGAYVQLTASTTSLVNRIEIFDTSGEVLTLAVGASGSEVDQLYIFAGGNGYVDLSIPSGSRISVKAKTATANNGLLAINLYS